ncbi:MAG: phosphate ABC transporter substrate-binding protein [Syntrophomonadaceae bacterium]
MKRQNLLIVGLISLLMMVLLVGCSSDSAETPEGATPQADTSIRIGGSSTLSPIIAKCADNFTEEFKTWDKVDASLPAENIVIFVSTGGSGFGVKSTIDGTFDLGLVARTLKDEEKAELEGGQTNQIGSDVLTIAVNPNNPITTIKPDISREELKNIFAGEITTWNQLDPALPDKAIIVAVRDLGGGASEVFDTAVMKGTPISKDAQQIPSMGALAGKVMENDMAIGYVSSGLVNQNADKLFALSIDGIAPTLENIKSGEYDIGRPLLIITKSEPTAKQQAFLDYLMSDKGFAVVEDLGYIPNN